MSMAEEFEKMRLLRERDEARAALEEARREREGLAGLLKRLQEAATDYLTPDMLSARDFINAVLSIVDGPEVRSPEVRAALAKAGRGAPLSTWTAKLIRELRSDMGPTFTWDIRDGDGRWVAAITANDNATVARMVAALQMEVALKASLSALHPYQKREIVEAALEAAKSLPETL